MKFIDWFKAKNKLINENSKMRHSKKNLEEKYNNLLEEKNEISNKYLALLEQKSERFDLYIQYQEQCVVLNNDKKELKKQLAESNEKYNVATHEKSNMQDEISKLEKKIKRLEKKNEKSA